jgi:hypothetical protein
VIKSTNKTDCNDITEILLNVALNTINPYGVIFSIYQSAKIFPNLKILNSMMANSLGQSIHVGTIFCVDLSVLKCC